MRKLSHTVVQFLGGGSKHLFGLIGQLRDAGTAVIYISHRLHEVEEIADRISVLRDGQLIETRDRAGFTHDQIIDMIVGRPLDMVFPKKQHQTEAGNSHSLSVRELSGDRFSDVTFKVRPGELVGLTGVEGQGQREFIRALAGLGHVTSGSIEIAGNRVDCASVHGARNAGIRFVTDDRHLEGIFGSLSVRENIALGQLASLSTAGVVSHSAETEVASSLRQALNIKSASIEERLNTLSGGNQQKVLLSRETYAEPLVLLVDEPTKGVDVGSRSEIYHKLRKLSELGIPVIILSSDGLELEGLCDRVLVFSRGQVATELAGEEVTDADITAANLKSTVIRKDTSTHNGDVSPLRLFLQKDYFASIVLGLLSLAVVLTTATFNDRFLSPYNIQIVATFLSVLALVSAAQLLIILIGEIDLSVGPLTGLTVVLASFFIPDGASGVQIVFGSAGLLIICAAIGFLQGLAVVILKLPSMVTTLATFFAFQGISLMLRPTPAGPISYLPGEFLATPVFGVPLVILLVLIVMIAFERILVSSGFGRSIRAIGSDADSAHKIGLNKAVLGPVVFAISGFFVGLGGLVLAAEVGIGSATTGTNYTLMSITAVVLGGAVIGGGRGSFISVLLGAALVQITWTSSSFL